MRTAYRQLVMMLGVTWFLCTPAVGQTNVLTSGLPPLFLAAAETLMNWSKAVQQGNEGTRTSSDTPEIAAKYWSDPIKKLKPVKVYEHRMNVVVVQKIADGIEEGTYLLTGLSCHYGVAQGVDGFEFTPDLGPARMGDGIFHFTRSKAN